MAKKVVATLTKDNTFQLIKHGIFNLEKYKGYMLRMRHIYINMMELFQKYKPDEVAIESIFYSNNVQSMLKLGRAQGIAIATALAFEIPITEYTPRKIKQAITGNGNASKEQVATMVGHLLKIFSLPISLDATDALAVALCHSSQKKLSVTSKYKSWKKFIVDNY